jgi:Kef-type K+ transport system membrane component KefB
LAVVVAIARANGFEGALTTIGCSLAFVLVMLLAVRPRIAVLLEKNFADERAVVVIALLLVFASALLTDLIGIHALFGAFLAGAIMPPQAQVSRLLHERVETFGTAFLLPLFFAFTGLRTQINLLNDGSSWVFCAAIIGVAIAGKFGGTLLAARGAGMGWHASLSLGALMNTRGLMELIVLNIGYDLGILSPGVFAMMVIMALVTTFMTGPLLDLFEAIVRRRQIRGAVRLSR